ncbi:hypothetical protein GQ600_16187 [Phytophthora cactorum]|nr:hypothetical protein GQ600_16187 [Phytophthora cactorum]
MTRLQSLLDFNSDLRLTLPNITCSPFGAVAKAPDAGTGNVRGIHDLSYPEMPPLMTILPMQTPSRSLRRAIVEVLGPKAITEDKHLRLDSRREKHLVCCRIFFLSKGMPKEKIVKALLCVKVMLESRATSTSQVNKLPGSLRHAATCAQAGAPFYQRPTSLTYSSRRMTPIPVTEDVRNDLHWI